MEKKIILYKVLKYVFWDDNHLHYKFELLNMGWPKLRRIKITCLNILKLLGSDS